MLQSISEKGVPTAVDGEELDAVSLVEKLNKLGGENGIGLLDIVENPSCRYEITRCL